MADYDVIQLTEGEYYPDDEGEYSDDLSYPLNRYSSISHDGQRVVYASQMNPGRPGYAIWLYDRGADPLEPRRLSVSVDGDDRVLASYYPQISGDGQKVVFDAQFYYTDVDGTGIYVYDIESGTIRRVVDDEIPRLPSGAPQDGEPDMYKNVASRPSISGDGQWLSYVWTHYVYSGATHDHWIRSLQQLMLADLSGDEPVLYNVAEIGYQNVHGHGIQSLKISGDGRTIAFYAGGVIAGEGLDVANFMPDYVTVDDLGYGGVVCNVHCYVVRVNDPGDYELHTVPDPAESTSPLIVARTSTDNVNSFRTGVVLSRPPSLTADGSKVALNAGFVMGAANTGVYIYEPLSGDTSKVIAFDATPGDDPDEGMLHSGAVPAISADGRYLAYYRREVSFPYNYADVGEYMEGETYCPCVNRDEVVVQDIQVPDGETSNLIETSVDPILPCYTPGMGLGLAQDASHVVFISRANKVGENEDLSHEVYYAALVEESGSFGRMMRWMRLRLRPTTLNYLLVILATAAVIVALRRMGLTLVIGPLVASVVTVVLFAPRSPAVLAAAAFIGGVVGMAGTVLLGQATQGAMMAGLLVCTAFLLLALLFTPWRSVRRWLRRTRK